MLNSAKSGRRLTPTQQGCRPCCVWLFRLFLLGLALTLCTIVGILPPLPTWWWPSPSRVSDALSSLSSPSYSTSSAMVMQLKTLQQQVVEKDALLKECSDNAKAILAVQGWFF